MRLTKKSERNPVNLRVESLEYSAEMASIMAEFGKPLAKMDIDYLISFGFSPARGLGASCMNWMWLQWLLRGSVVQIRENVEAFVDKGMAMQDKSSQFYMCPHADLYLLHCAIFASNQSQLVKLASRVIDASGTARYKPEDRGGERYASAWCGMLKYWILGDLMKAEEQSELIWDAHRCPSFAAASKTLVTPWLKSNWDGFGKAQRKDFEKLWARGAKDGTVRSRTGTELVPTSVEYRHNSVNPAV